MNPPSGCTLGLLLLILGCGLGPPVRASQPGDVVEVPFDFCRDAIIVQARIEGKGPFNMLLDTGVDPSLIDLKVAGELGLNRSSVGHRAAGGGTEVNLAYETPLPLVELGNLAAGNIDALAVDMARMSGTLGRPIQGVLGYSLLKNRIVQIDYPKRVARFCSGSPCLKVLHPSSGASSTTLSFRYRDDILVRGVKVNGEKMIANVDTGSNGSFQLTPAAVTRLGLETEVGRARVSESVGINGASENREGILDNVSLGGISVDRPTVVFLAKGTGHDKEAWGIRIGNSFLRGFVVTIDYPGERITLERP